MIDREGIRLRWEALGCKLDERGQRLFAANEVRAAGHGALAIVSQITELARSTINRGEDDLDEGPLREGRVRRKGGGPKPLCERDPTLVPDLARLAEPATMGDPMRPLKWVSKSPAKLAAALNEGGHEVCANTVAKLLETKLEYSRQFNRKTHEGASHPDRPGRHRQEPPRSRRLPLHFATDPLAHSVRENAYSTGAFAGAAQTRTGAGWQPDEPVRELARQ
jgi:hypothetical protein